MELASRCIRSSPRAYATFSSALTPHLTRGERRDERKRKPPAQQTRDVARGFVSCVRGHRDIMQLKLAGSCLFGVFFLFVSSGSANIQRRPEAPLRLKLIGQTTAKLASLPSIERAVDKIAS